MPDVYDGTSSLPADLRRCPGCRNQVTTRTPLCPVCGKHATVARALSVVRWTIIAGGAVTVAWWWVHRG